MDLRRLFVLAPSLAALVGLACGKDEPDPITVPMDPANFTPPPPPPKAPPPPEPTPSASTPPPPPTGKIMPRPDISACCGALQAEARVAVDQSMAERLRQAVGVCVRASDLVKEGKTSRESALNQVRAFVGGKTPSACR